MIHYRTLSARDLRRERGILRHVLRTGALPSGIPILADPAALEARLREIGDVLGVREVGL